VNAAIGAAADEEEAMKFMVTRLSDGTSMDEMTPEQRQEMGAKMMQVMGELEEAGVLADSGAPLAPPAEAKTLRYGAEGRVVVTDGPFAETKEHVAGYIVLECSSLDEATDWAKKLPMVGGSVEVRPLAERI
jgi:hypothetical protein